MKHSLIFLIFLTINLSFIFSQTQNYIGLKYGYNLDVFSYKNRLIGIENIENLEIPIYYIKSGRSFSFDLVFGKSIKDNYIFETGIKYKEFRMNLEFDEKRSQTNEKNSFKFCEVIQIPFHLLYENAIFKSNKFNFYIGSGFNIGIDLNLDKDDVITDLHQVEVSSTRRIEYSGNFISSSKYSAYKIYYSSFQSSLGLSYYPIKNLNIRVGSSFVKSFGYKYEGNFSARFYENNDPSFPYSVKVKSHLNYFSFDVQINYLLTKNKKK